MSLLKHPSVKLLVKHLNNSHAVRQTEDHQNSGSSKSNLQTWTCTTPLGSFSFAVVWIQGHILEVEEGGKSAVVSDGTGQIVLTACDKVSAKPEIKKGMYMMAIGTLNSSNSDESLQMKPFKLQNLSKVDQVEESWPLEVADQIHYLTSQVT